MNQFDQKKLDGLVGQALATLSRFPRLEATISGAAVEASIRESAPGPPAPLALWLAIADGHLGGEAAERCLSGVDFALGVFQASLPTGPSVFGAWQSRVSRLSPPPRAATQDDFSGFYSAWFEVLASFRLLTDVTRVHLEGSGPDPFPDLTIIDQGRELVRVEAYCPLKGIQEWLQGDIVAPWHRLLGVPVNQPPAGSPTTVVDISLDPNAMTEAVANILTDGNFPGGKARQLTAGTLPTLFALRGYRLTPRLEEVLTMPKATDLSARMGDAWGRLPALCAGLLICFIGDILDLTKKVPPCMFVPAPGARVSDELWDYLDRARLLGKDVLATRNPDTGPS